MVFKTNKNPAFKHRKIALSNSLDLRLQSRTTFSALLAFIKKLY